MPRVHFVKKARKSYKGAGIKKGESYYWWKFRFSGKHMQKTAPSRSQLTQSDFLSTVWGIEDGLAEVKNIEDAQSERDSAVEELRSLADDCSDKQSNMPDSLQYSDTGQLLEDRSNYCNEYADELEAVDLDIEKEETESDEDFEKRVEEALDELSSCSYQGE